MIDGSRPVIYAFKDFTAAITFEVAVGPVRPHFLEISAESMTGEPNEPILKRRTAPGVECQPEAVYIN